jgi:hypothetical protein
MRHIEQELHQMLEEIVPNSSMEEQARIIAEATAFFKAAEKSKNKTKTASQCVRESMMADALLKAIGTLDDWNQDHNDNYGADFVDGRGLDHRAIISQASGIANRTAKSDLWGDMDILNEDLEEFLSREDEDEEGYEIEDGHDEHTSEVFFSPGRGRHRSDSLSR